MKKVLFKALFLLCAFSMPGIINAQKSTKTTQQSGEVVITQPEFKGGMEGLYKYILEQFEYPEEAAKRAVSGTMEQPKMSSAMGLYDEQNKPNGYRSVD